MMEMTPNGIAQAILDFLKTRKSAYQTLFSEGIDAELVLKDLREFCRADKSTFHPDSHVSAKLDGRREVWLRINQHLNLTTEDLYRLYGKGEDK